MEFQLNWVDSLIILAYLSVVVGLGVYVKRRAAKNIGSYFLGDRELPWWALAMSGSSSYFDITGTMWIVSLFVMIGIKGLWVQWVWGFIIPAFYLAYMGKWIRRSGVMTGSEWMETRFGKDRAGELARASYTFYAVLTITAFLAYGSTGMGKFGAVYLPWNEHVCAALIIGITGIYVIIGGFRGVVLVEIFQTVILSAGAILLAAIAFVKVSPAQLAEKLVNKPEWGSLVPRWDFSYLSGTEYTLFGALLMVWVVKGVLLSLSGPEQLYDFQRFLAARTPREASKLGALWGAIHTVRWPMAMGLAVMGIVGLAGTGDPEKVLPQVIHDMTPTGVRGFVIAALLSGFLATFNSTVNGGASYIVKDIYHKYMNPNATQSQLIRASYISSALLIIVGISAGFAAKSIDQMFTWIMGTLGAGVLMPNVLRWYWWRVNGWGYAAGAFSGMLLSLIQAFWSSQVYDIAVKVTYLFPEDIGYRCFQVVNFFSGSPLYAIFPLIAGSVFAITIVVTLLTPPTEAATLMAFYRQVRPAGFWKPVAAACGEPELARRAKRVFLGDLVAVAVAIPWLIAMYLCPIYLVLHRFTETGITLAIVAVASVGLYFAWYKRLEED